jgi:hypothetical protein
LKLFRILLMMVLITRRLPFSEWQSCNLKVMVPTPTTII